MSRDLLPLKLDEVWVAVEARYVREILGPRPWVPIPGASDKLPGVLAWKGRAVAVVDLGALTGYCAPLGLEGHRERTVMLEVGPVTFAVLANAVREVHTVSDQDVRTAHLARQKLGGQEVELFQVPVPILDLDSVVRAVT